MLTDVIFYISDSRIGMILPDGSGECYPEFRAPNQVCWQLAYLFPDGRQAVLWSREPPGNPHAAFGDPDGLAFAKTHLWRYDFAAQSMLEMDLPPYASIIGLLPDDRLLVIENNEGVASIYAAGLDGSGHQVCFASPGYAYGSALNPDGRQVAFHITGAPGGGGYEIFVIDLGSGDRKLIAGDPAWLNFAPAWSPDGQWLLYQRCAHRDDPGHDHSDLWLSRPDGSEHRALTSGQSHWFAAAMGTPERHSSGSNGPAWSPDGRIAAALLLPESQTAWPYRAGQPDLDHFNRDYRPELARGGTQLCLIAPDTGAVTPITHDDPPAWYFRPVWSPDGARLVVGRVEVGGQPELWVMGRDGGNRRLLTRGIDDLGADHARWRQLAVNFAAKELCNE